ncbi:hypothetical protein [Brevundimonas sp.]|uniref:hypothetical protein n=1 Tax=Brevundimonas sp. TaxID=1871086 RepID=UPI002898978D|nr:hypothetical protein [Brevundimonas sp.]
MNKNRTKTKSKHRIILAHIGVLSAIYCTPAFSQSASAQDRQSTMNLLVNCLEITDTAQRLACFDSQALIVKNQINAGELVAVYKNEIAETQRSLFGIDRIRMPSFFENSNESVNEINATIESAIRSPIGKWHFVLDDRSEWVQIDTTNPYFNTRKGAPVRIRRGSLNSYFLTVGNSSAIRVSRRR